MPQQPSRDYSELTALMQALVNPLINKLASLEDKVDRLGQDRATRSDIEKLRSELIGAFVPRDAYEPHRTALIERDASIDASVKELRKDMGEDFQRMEERIKAQTDAQLTDKDRAWLRWSQFMGAAGIIIALLDWLSQHLKF